MEGIGVRGEKYIGAAFIAVPGEPGHLTNLKQLNGEEPLHPNRAGVLVSGFLNLEKLGSNFIA